MGVRVLIVDDANFMRCLLKNILESAGFDIIAEGSDGLEAITMYARHRPDLVFMDITMPNLTGLEALKEIMKLNPKARVIMCSAMGQECMVREAFVLGAKDFIIKPFDAKVIMSKAQDVLNVNHKNVKDSRVLSFEHQNRHVLNSILTN